jgi:hypothetical protein
MPTLYPSFVPNRESILIILKKPYLAAGYAGPDRCAAGVACGVGVADATSGERLGLGQ